MKPSARGSGLAHAPGKRKVLIVDDHPIVRQGLRLMIDEEPDLKVCGEAQSEREARVAIRDLEPDVVIVDISLAQGDGLELVRDVHAHHPDLPMLVLSMHDELIYAERLLAAGASGYIMKHAASDQLLVALRRVLAGEQYLSESLAENLGRMRGGGESRTTRDDPIERLSNRGAAGAEPDRAGAIFARSRRSARFIRKNRRDSPAELEAQAQPRDERATASIRYQLVHDAQ